MDATSLSPGPVPDTTTTLLGLLATSSAPAAAWTRFARLYDPVCRYYLAVLRRAWPALRRDWDDDIVQETFVAIAKTLPERRWDRTRGRFRDYLFGIVRNKAREFARRENRFPSPPEGDLPRSAELAEAASDAASAEREALRRELWRALVDRVFVQIRMSETSKAAFLRLVEDEAPVEEVAAEFGMTPNALYRLKNRMSEKLREAWLAVAPPDGDLADALEALARDILATSRQIPRPSGK